MGSLYMEEAQNSNFLSPLLSENISKNFNSVEMRINVASGNWIVGRCIMDRCDWFIQIDDATYSHSIKRCNYESLHKVSSW